MAVAETALGSEIRGAVARGWTHEDTEHKEMDVVLAEAIAEEVIALLTTTKARITALEEALLWCSGSQDFAPGGRAALGWDRLCRPLLVAPGAIALSDKVQLRAENLALWEIVRVVQDYVERDKLREIASELKRQDGERWAVGEMLERACIFLDQFFAVMPPGEEASAPA